MALERRMLILHCFIFIASDLVLVVELSQRVPGGAGGAPGGLHGGAGDHPTQAQPGLLWAADI